MIPKYIFDTEQTNLLNLSTKDKMIKYRMKLYKILRWQIKKYISQNQKFKIINEYKLKVSEIDYQLIILNKKEINKN